MVELERFENLVFLRELLAHRDSVPFYLNLCVRYHTRAQTAEYSVQCYTIAHQSPTPNPSRASNASVAYWIFMTHTLPLPINREKHYSFEAEAGHSRIERLRARVEASLTALPCSSKSAFSESNTGRTRTPTEI